MNKYKIYQHPSRRVKLIEPVKQGDSVPAFFFTWLWALSKRLWFIAFTGWLFSTAGLIFYFEIFAYADNSPLITKLSLIILDTVFMLSINGIFGVKGNSWCEYYLTTSGYEQANKEIDARTPDEARRKFMCATTIRTQNSTAN